MEQPSISRRRGWYSGTLVLSGLTGLKSVGCGCFNDVRCEPCCRGRPTEPIHLRVNHSQKIDRVQDEKDRAQDGSLWHAADQGSDLLGPRRTYDRYDWNQQMANTESLIGTSTHILGPGRQVRLEPTEGCVANTEGLLQAL